MQGCQEYDCSNKNVSSCCLNVSNDGCEVSVVGRLFHTCAATTEKSAVNESAATSHRDH